MTINDIQLKHEVVKADTKKKKRNNNQQTDARLSLKATIKTYRYLSEEEVDEEG